MIRERVNKLEGRITNHVVSALNSMYDPTHLLDLIDALESIENYNSIPDVWDKKLTTQYKPKLFKKGKLSEWGLWHAHFPLGSYASMAATNLLKPGNLKRAVETFAHDVNRGYENNPKMLQEELESKTEEFTNKFLSSVTGVGGDQAGNVTADWLIFKRVSDVNYYLLAITHLELGDIGDEVAEKAIAAAKDIAENIFSIDY